MKKYVKADTDYEQLNNMTKEDAWEIAHTLVDEKLDELKDSWYEQSSVYVEDILAKYGVPDDIDYELEDIVEGTAAFELIDDALYMIVDSM